MPSHSLDTSDAALLRLARHSRAGAIMTLIGAGVLAAVLTYSSYKLNHLQVQTSILEQQLAAKRREIESAEKTLQAVAEHIHESGSTGSTQRILQEEIGSQAKVNVESTRGNNSFVVVLGSYRHFKGAIEATNNLRSMMNENVRLLYSVGDYYAPVIGPFESRKAAEQQLNRIRSKVPDSFVFTSGAFLYEIKIST